MSLAASISKVVLRISLSSKLQTKTFLTFNQLVQVFHSAALNAFMYSNLVSLLSFSVFSWVNNFGHEGLGVLLDVLEKLLDKKQ